MLSTLIILAISVYLFNEFYWKRRKLPPGPVPLPLLGNMGTVFNHEPGYEAFRLWRQKYGPVYTYWLGPYPTVVISDYETIKETIIRDGDKYTARFRSEMMQIYRGGEYGIVESSGDLWKEQRRFALHTLRDFGMGKNLMEEKVMTEVGFLLDRISTQQSVSIQWEFDVAVGSIINNILFGYRFDEDTLEEFGELKGLLGEHMKLVASPAGGLVLMVPWTRYLPICKDAYERLFYIKDRIFGHFRKQLSQRKKPTIDEISQPSSDFVDAYLKEQLQHKDQFDFGGFHMTQLENVIFDLWIAGMETTSNTLTWGIAYILNDLKVQEMIHSELDSQIKSDRLITLSDRNQLNYLNATIMEIQRMANLLPVNLLRRTTEDLIINGFPIPAGTDIIPQICCVLLDEKIFPDPYSFKPERFLNKDGSLRKVEELIPFSVGKRQCLGEGLARIELFLFLANIFQRFKISSKTKPSLKKSFGFTVQTQSYTCEFEERY